MIKAQEKLGVERAYFNVTKVIFYKPLSNMLSGEAWKHFLKPEKKDSVNIVLKVLAILQLIKPRELNKGDTNRKKEK